MVITPRQARSTPSPAHKENEVMDINELRRLAQAATPHVGHACKYQDAHWLREGHVDFENADLFIASERPQEDAAFYAAANPTTVIEILDRLEDAESDALEQARLNGMGSEREAALMAKLEAAENENAKLREALAEKVISETMLRDLNVGNGSINASFEGGAVHLLVDSLATQFVESGATNYLEMQFHSEATGPLLLTLQRVNGKTPHQLRAESEKERDQLRSDLATAEQDSRQKQARIERLEKLEAAALNLVKMKGRHHTEIAYRRLVAALEESK